MPPLRTVARSSLIATGWACLCLMAVPVEAGEKIRFGTSSAVIPRTQPERSAGPEMELRPVSERIRPVQSAPAMAAPPAAVVRPAAAEELDRSDWIFRDTQSQEGIRQALGVENYDPAQTTPTRDSVADYFARQRTQGTAGQAPGLPSASGQWSALPGATPYEGLAPKLDQGALGPGEAPGTSLYGASSFRNTLNSDNPAVRRYFRELYNAPASSSALAGQSSGQPNDPLTTPAASESSASSGLSDFARRAALIDSLTPTTPLAPTFDSGRPAAAPAPTEDPRVPTVNNGQLFERRNGLIEIPGRKF